MGKGANPGQRVNFVCLAMSRERGKPWATCSFCMFGNEWGEGVSTLGMFFSLFTIIAPTKFRLGKQAEITFWTKLNSYFKQIRSILKGQCTLPRCGQKTK